MQIEVKLINQTYQKIGLLGVGGFGKVYLCQKVAERPNRFILNRIRNTEPEKVGRYYALKRFYRPSDDQNGLDYTTLRDIKFLCSLEHPNILKCHEIICVRKETGQFSLYMVLEFMLDVLRAQSQLPQLNEEKNIKILAYHVLLGLDFLHNKFIFHRDLKPDNIFISKEGIAKIGDFGMSREFGTPDIDYSKRVCTAEYRAPEIFFETSYYTEKSDIWAFGCTFATFFTRKDLFYRQQQQNLDTVVLQKIFYLLGTPNEETWPGFSKFPRFMQFQDCQPKNLQKQLGIPSQPARIIKSCLSLDPRKRPSAKNLLEHDYFLGVKGQILPIGEYYEKELQNRKKNARMQYE